MDSPTLTTNQLAVLRSMEHLCRKHLEFWNGHQSVDRMNRELLMKGDRASVNALGVLTVQVGSVLGMKSGTVLGIFKQLREKGLVVVQPDWAGKGRPRYWWPVGLAKKLCDELGLKGEDDEQQN